MRQTRNRCRKRHQMRCRNSKCYARFTLKLAPNQYHRAPRCPRCGCNSVRDVTEERKREKAKQVRCYCSGYPFPHRAGSIRMCSQHPLAAIEPTPEEWDAYDSVISTPRSSDY